MLSTPATSDDQDIECGVRKTGLRQRHLEGGGRQGRSAELATGPVLREIHPSVGPCGPGFGSRSLARVARDSGVGRWPVWPGWAGLLWGLLSSTFCRVVRSSGLRRAACWAWFVCCVDLGFAVLVVFSGLGGLWVAFCSRWPGSSIRRVEQLTGCAVEECCFMAVGRVFAAGGGFRSALREVVAVRGRCADITPPPPASLFLFSLVAVAGVVWVQLFWASCRVVGALFSAGWPERPDRPCASMGVVAVSCGG